MRVPRQVLVPARVRVWEWMRGARRVLVPEREPLAVSGRAQKGAWALAREPVPVRVWAQGRVRGAPVLGPERGLERVRAQKAVSERRARGPG